MPATSAESDPARPGRGLAGLPGDLSRAWARGPLLRVVTGSHLHGFAGAESDHDTWVVVHEPRDHHASLAAKKIWQVVERHPDQPDTDVTVVGLSTWMRYCDLGVPQALDVMFATGAAVQVDTLAHLRAGYRANPNTATPTFRRMMNQIVQHRSEVPKQRRHAFRLALNLLDIQSTGRYRPTLDEDRRGRVLALAERGDGFISRLEDVSGLAFG